MQFPSRSLCVSLFVVLVLTWTTSTISAQTFTSKRYEVGTEPRKLIRADFNGDNRVDFSTSNGDGTVTILINNGDGTFRRVDAIAGPSGSAINDEVAADFNKDGKTDLAVLSFNSSSVALNILTGRGDGTFNSPYTVVTKARGAAIVTADFNQDGKRDIALGWNTTYGNVTIYYGDGAGGFPTHKDMLNIGAPPMEPSTGEGAYGIVAMNTGDFDGNGRTDFAIAEIGGVDVPTSAGYAYINNGDNTFTQKTYYAGSALELRSFDIDRNGKSDLLVPYSGCHTPCVGVTVFTSVATSPYGKELPDPYLNGYSEIFRSATGGDFLPTGPRMVAYTVGGWYCNSADPYTNLLAFAARKADGSFELVKTINTGEDLYSWLTSADINGDGKDDLAGLALTASMPVSQFVVMTNTTPGCTVSTNRSVRICAPTSGATVTSPVRVFAGIRSDAGVSAAQIYVDGTKVYQAGSGTNTIDRNLSLSAGTHRITVKGWDAAGSFSSSVTVTVSGSGTTCSATTNRTVKICAPTSGSTTSSPVQLLAGLYSLNGITATQIYLDGTKVYQGSPGAAKSTTINQSLPMGRGTHRITVKGWDSAGSFSSSVSVTIP